MTEEKWAEFIKPCKCEVKYTIERHGKGYALYYGRCNHRHGYNLANIVEPAWNFNPEHIEHIINVGAALYDKNQHGGNLT